MDPTTRPQIMRQIADRVRPHGYLEIGCAKDECFSLVDAPFKIGVDPVEGGNLRMRSDAFFAAWAGPPFDLAFIDGDHYHDQVHRDIEGVLRNLSAHGLIVIHDCLPPDQKHEDSKLCGTAWRAFVHIRQRSDLEAFCVAVEYGFGIVWRAENTSPLMLPKGMDELVYADLVAWKDLWMRPSSLEEVLRRIP